MKRVLKFSMAAVLTVLVSGCEWDGTSGGDSWSSSYSWINFSGLYRGVNGPLVGNFTSTWGGGGGGTDTGPVTVVNNENGGTAPAEQTVLSGTLNFRPGITPGSVSIFLIAENAGDSSGTATDNGSGVLTGSYNLIGLDPSSSLPMTGTINYGTGAWTLNLPSPGLFTPCPIRINYTYSAETAEEDDDGESDLDTAGGVVMTMLVEQLGNKLTFTDSNGNIYTGFLSVVALAGGDRSGFTSGDLSATYEVKGKAEGKAIKISGSFSGAYTAPVEGQSNGNLRGRLLQGIWMQPNGTADVHGVAPLILVETQAAQ